MMSSHLAFPREGNLKEVFHVFSYLKNYIKSELVFNATVPEIDIYSFQKQDWAYSVYSNLGVYLKEEVPPNMPEPLGLPFAMQFFVDADHAGDNVTRRSRSGYIVFLNSAPIYWHSKKQALCETSTFGNNFLALKQSTEYTRELCYNLRIFGVPVTEPSFFMVTIIQCCATRLLHSQI